MQTYSSLEPQKYNVDLSFLGADNEVIEAGTTLKADVDSVVVNWSVKPEFSANATDTIRIQMCYTTPNINDRPWRKYNDVISKNKQCNLDIATGLTPSAEGTYTYFLPNYIPTSGYFMQVIAVQDVTGAYVSFGNSTSFQVEMIDDTPDWLRAVTGVLAAIGPITLIGFFVVERKMKAKKQTA